MEKNNTFTQGRILKPLILFALPVLLALFLQAMYGAVDLLIVGKFASSADVSAVSTGSQIMMTLTNLVSSFAMGTTVLLGQQISGFRLTMMKRVEWEPLCSWDSRSAVGSGNREVGQLELLL